MNVQVRYFASIREVLGAGESIEVPAGATIGELRDRLIASSAAHATALSRERSLRSALNQLLCDESEPVGADAEVAFFPPVTGG
ncbi:MAG TPA: MoaD/ThiS family protein [Burkholderiaceae bacterium]|jgi:molybdopterin synthase sulfur carrier subunit|nr:MoaD/ThiS family protein [Burkholderiaceae bacterium]